MKQLICTPGRLRSLDFGFGSQCVTNYTTDAFVEYRLLYRDLALPLNLFYQDDFFVPLEEFESPFYILEGCCISIYAIRAVEVLKGIEPLFYRS